MPNTLIKVFIYIKLYFIHFVAKLHLSYATILQWLQ